MRPDRSSGGKRLRTAWEQRMQSTAHAAAGPTTSACSVMVVAGLLLAGVRADQSGSIAIKFAVVLPLLMGIAALGTDYGWLLARKAQLQTAADAGALSGAKELSLSDAQRESVAAVVKSTVERLMAADGAQTAVSSLSITTNITDEPLEVEVQAFGEAKGFFAPSLFADSYRIEVRSVARVMGRPNICVLGLDPDADATISLDSNAQITGNNCAVFSNSTHTSGLQSLNNAKLAASVICSAGGINGGSNNFAPEPLTDCPTFEDPLASRPQPQPTTCPSSSLLGALLQPLRLDSLVKTLAPGVFCGGLTIDGNSRIFLEPGIYEIRDGELRVDATSVLTGQNVGFVFKGPNARFYFAPNSVVSLSAPKDGPMAGILFWGDRNQDPAMKHEILSNTARELIGTIYLPKGTLSINTDSPIADKSAYTAIVARKVQLNAGPNLVLNTNYDWTDVPVPQGIRGAGQPVALVK
jgi:Putative Flp pilus-assembly TadE/G-like